MTQHADLLAINAIRTLSIDAIEKANSGHPGLPMGRPMAYTLWTKQLRHNPANPKWFNRDRFVLSARPWFNAFIQLTSPWRLWFTNGRNSKLPPMGFINTRTS